MAIWWLIRKRSVTAACPIFVGINAAIRTLVNLVGAVSRFNVPMAAAAT